MATVAEVFRTMEYGPAPESDREALAWLAKHEGVFGHYIGGVWTEPGALFDVINPATNATIARVTNGTAADVDAAVSAARSALAVWQALAPHARARHLYALARAVQKHARLLAVLESMDNGKSIRETRDIDVPLVARHFYHHAGWAQLLESEFPGYGAIGVVGQIIPWNFPLLMLAWKIAPALAAGNTIILKPAEFTPLTALCFAEIAHEAGIPAGVINIVNGHGETGAALVEHPDVDKIAFTGSTDVGRIIRKATAGSGKKLSLELGGRVHSSSMRTRISTASSKALWTRSGSIRDRSAAPAHDCSCRKVSPSGSSRSCGRGWRSCASVLRSTKRWTWARSSLRCSSSESGAWSSRVSLKEPRCGNPRGPVPPKDVSIRRPCSPTSSRRRRLRKLRFSDRCSCQ